MDCGLLIFSLSLGFCCVEYSVCEAVANQGSPYSLSLLDPAPPAAPTGKNGGQCTLDYITIEGGNEVCGSPIFYSKFCGDVLSTYSGAAPPAVNNPICGKLLMKLKRLISVEQCRFMRTLLQLFKTFWTSFTISSIVISLGY